MIHTDTVNGTVIELQPDVVGELHPEAESNTQAETNVQEEEKELFKCVNASEITPWSPTYLKKFRPTKKPIWRYFTGTMPDLHHRIRNHPPLLAFFAVFRALGLWMGISNPLLGMFVFMAACQDSWYNVVYLVWGISWMLIWSLVMGAPRELIYNGLYPAQGILLTYIVYVSSDTKDQFDNLLPQLTILVLLQLLTLFLFEALCSFFIKVLKVSPMMIAPTIVAILYKAVKQKSTILGLPEPPDGITPDPANLHYFNQTFSTACLEVVNGLANMVFSSNPWCSLYITLGMAFTSPILLVMCWMGTLMAVVTEIFLSPVWSEVARRFYTFQGVITMPCIAGIFFVLNKHSFFVGIFCCFCSTFVTIGLHTLLEGVKCFPVAGLGCYMIVIPVLCTAGSFPNMIPVELADMTTPEDHLRRYMLSKRILQVLKIDKSYRHLTSSYFRSIELSLLPLLLCCYAKQGYLKNIKRLLVLGADPNTSGYDGRTALHIAATDNQGEVVYLLLRRQADINKVDYYQNTALTAALDAGHYELALYIHKKGGQILLPRGRVACLLCGMVYRDQVDMLQAWLKCGADPNCKDYANRTALHIAYSLNKQGCIDLLKDYTTVQGMEEAKEVIQRQHRVRPITRPKLKVDNPRLLHDVVTYIMSNEEEMKKKGSDTVLLPSLICEMAYISQHDIISELIADYKDLGIQTMADYDTRTPLHIAASVGDLEVVKLLLWNRANVNALDRFGTTPLLEACRSRHTEVAVYLRDHGAKMDISQDEAVTELFWAVYNNDFDMVSRLLEHGGLDVNTADYGGRNCLHLARDIGNTNMVEHLTGYISEGDKN